MPKTELKPEEEIKTPEPLIKPRPITKRSERMLQNNVSFIKSVKAVVRKATITYEDIEVDVDLFNSFDEVLKQIEVKVQPAEGDEILIFDDVNKELFEYKALDGGYRMSKIKLE
jgi:hypothetical protein